MSCKNVTNEEIIRLLEELVGEWLGQFENPPKEAPISFCISDSGMLCVNGVVLLRAQDLDLNSLTWDVESLNLSSVQGDLYEIGINWRVVGPPYMAFVNKVATLYIAP